MHQIIGRKIFFCGTPLSIERMVMFRLSADAKKTLYISVVSDQRIHFDLDEDRGYPLSSSVLSVRSVRCGLLSPCLGVLSDGTEPSGPALPALLDHLSVSEGIF